MSGVKRSVALPSETAEQLRSHLLQHIERNRWQEELCFALWRPSAGRTRHSAILTEAILPEPGERRLHGGAGFLPGHLERVIGAARKNEAGVAFLHSHFTPGWQEMSNDDVVAEQRRLAPRVLAATDLPLVGLTMGTDGALSARFWPRVGPGEFERTWCGTARVVGDGFSVTFMERLAPKPGPKEALRRTCSAWGAEKQGLLSRLHCGVVGAGSVGALVAEALVRMGVETVSLIDPDTVKEHNLDRLLHATTADIGQRKVDVARKALCRHSTANDADIRSRPYSVTRADGREAALDCDILFSCGGRPWPRQVLNPLAYAHLIPVIDGGIRVGVTPAKKLRSADWRAHVALPGRPCLECLGQYDPADVSMEREGLLDDPTYIEGLPDDHAIHRNENVFAFAMNTAGLMTLQFLSLVVQPSGVSNAGAQMYHLSTGTIDKWHDPCKASCLFQKHLGHGARFPFQLVDPIPPAGRRQRLLTLVGALLGFRRMNGGNSRSVTGCRR